MGKAIIFDMDGVIADTETAYFESFKKTVEKFNIKIDKDEWFKRFPGTGTIHTMSTIFKEHNIKPKEGLNPWLESWKKEYEKILNDLEIRPIKGFLEFNKKLNKLGIKKIIATGSHKRNALIVLKSFGIEKEFDIVGNEDVKQRKPDPELFLMAAKKLNSKPQDCVVFEDSPVGIRAAKKAKMRCVALITTYPLNLLEKENPDLMINNYTEIDIEKILK